MKITLTPEMIAQIKPTPTDAFLADFVVRARTLSSAQEQAETILHARLDKQPCVKSESVTITRVEQGGRYSVKDAPGIFAALKTIMPERAIANVVGYPTGKIKDAIAEQLQIPKSGKAANTAESVFAAKFADKFEQGKRRVLIFS